MGLKERFFHDLTSAQNYWVRTATESITSEQADLIWVQNEAAFKALQAVLKDKGVSADVEAVMQEFMHGFAHSFLCILDGATEMASHGRVYLVDEGGTRLGEGLHEEYQAFLFDHGENS